MEMFFLVRIFLYTDWIWRRFVWSIYSCIRAEYGDVFSGPNTGKYEPEKILYLDTFHAVKGLMFVRKMKKGTQKILLVEPVFYSEC